jgi:fibronectin type 3 domain-containing protein
MKKLLLAIALVLLASPLFAGNVTLAWTQSVSTDVTHNKVYWGTAPRGYSNSVQITAAVTYTVSGLPEDGATYYFAVTALDAAGNESGYSNEVFTSIPDTTPPEPPTGLQKTEELTLDTHSDGTVSLRIARYAPADKAD